MRHLSSFLFVASTVVTSMLLQAQAPALPQTTKTAKIEELFRLTNTEKIQKQMISQMTTMMKQQTAASIPAGQRQAVEEKSQQIMDFVGKNMSWDAMKADFIKLYDDTYTEDEISGILLFYESPPGQAMLAKTPVLMANTMALVQKRMTEIRPELDKMIKENVSK